MPTPGASANPARAALPVSPEVAVTIMIFVPGAVVRARAGHEAGQHLEGDVFEGARGAVPQLEHVRGYAVGVGRREALHGRDFGIGKVSSYASETHAAISSGA